MSESQEQTKVVNWCDRRDILIFSIPNGGYGLPVGVARRLKREGLKSGVPDLFIPIPVDNQHGLFVEMKALKRGRTSEDQKKWLSMLSDQNYRCVVAHGAEAAKTAIVEYLKLTVY